MTIDASSKIDVTGKGYLAGTLVEQRLYRPYVRNTTTGGSGASSGGSYGGLGGVYSGSVNGVYGDPTNRMK